MVIVQVSNFGVERLIPSLYISTFQIVAIGVRGPSNSQVNDNGESSYGGALMQILDELIIFTSFGLSDQLSRVLIIWNH